MYKHVYDFTSLAPVVQNIIAIQLNVTGKSWHLGDFIVLRFKNIP
jgi:hypothetical protein